jgi:thioredoxin-like negative regulator of GroEL
MDGRRFLRWWLCGGLFVGAVGCNRGSYHDKFGMPRPGETVAAIAANAGTRPSLFGRTPSGPPGPGQAVPGMPGPVPNEVATPTRRSGKGLLPETEATLADTHIAAALADPPPANRDELLDMARQRYQRALKADPKNKAALRGTAGMYARLGDRDRAVEAYKKYLKHFPKDHELMHDVAVTHAQWKDWAGAAGWCEQALRVDPENRTYRKTLGFCLARGGRWEDAFAVFCQVMPEAQARYSIARVLEHQNHADASREQLQLALKADPTFEPAREFLVELTQPAQPTLPALPEIGPDGNPIRQAGYAPQPGQ